jgi:hypothetical protein
MGPKQSTLINHWSSENHGQITWSTTASGPNSAVADHALQAVTALPAVILQSKSCAPGFGAAGSGWKISSDLWFTDGLQLQNASMM